jgi:hypothetical protein
MLCPYGVREIDWFLPSGRESQTSGESKEPALRERLWVNPLGDSRDSAGATKTDARVGATKALEGVRSTMLG